MVQKAPTFAELYHLIKEFIGNDTIVCHNASTDINIISRCTEYYGLNPLCNEYEDTYMITGESLTESCQKKGISIEGHHNALDDAEMCARLYMSCNGIIDKYDIETFDKRTSFIDNASREINHETLVQIDLNEVTNKSTIFFDKKIVITGILDNYPKREILAKKLQQYGADINTVISTKTNIVIIGHKAGPVKLTKIQKLKDAGNDIRIIYETELMEILNNI
jgi:DNA polymerase-3 subunit epsilon